MKLKLTAILFSLSAFITACKFDSTPEGVYQGTYTAYGLPSTSGDGTLHIESLGSNNYNLMLNTTGNPDIFFTNVSLGRRGTLYGGIYDASNYSVADTSYSMTVYECDYYDRSPWKAYLTYDEQSSFNSLTFQGNRIN